MFNEEFRKFKRHNKGQSIVDTLQRAYNNLLGQFKSYAKIPKWLEVSFENFSKINTNNNLMTDQKELVLQNLTEKLYIETYLHLGNVCASRILRVN